MKRKTLRQIIKERCNMNEEIHENFILGDEFEAWLKTRKQDSITIGGLNMKENEYLDIMNMKENVELVTANHLKNKSDRTLLYGYDCDRNTFHVYLKDENIHVVKYNSSKILTVLNVFSNEDYVPNKRVYPQYSDFEFCKLLIEKDVYIPFSNYEEPIKNTDIFVGEVV